MFNFHQSDWTQHKHVRQAETSASKTLNDVPSRVSKIQQVCLNEVAVMLRNNAGNTGVGVGVVVAKASQTLWKFV